MRAMSRRWLISPDGPARMTMSPNSCSVLSRPCVFTEIWKLAWPGAGGAPTWPAATWTFCSRSAAITSPGVIEREASFSGSSQMRME